MNPQETNTGGSTPPRYRRRLRNYLLDVGLQVRYTAFIAVIAIFLTGVLGAKIYEATSDTSRVILMTGMVDPSITGELEAQFRANDRIVLFGIFGFGVLLVMSVFGAGIWITHKVAGPIYSLGMACARVRDNNLGTAMRNLRKGDELQEFHSIFREMYQALRSRSSSDVQTLTNAIAVLESAADQKSPQVQEALTELRDLRRQKEQSLEGGDA